MVDDRSKYVESGLWDGHFRDSAAREGLVLRSPDTRTLLSASAERVERPWTVPRWPFAARSNQRSDVPMASGSSGSAGALSPPVDGIDTKFSKARAQEILCQLSAHRREAELRIASVWASAIKDVGSRLPEGAPQSDQNMQPQVDDAFLAHESHGSLEELARLRAKMREELAMLEADAEAMALLCRSWSASHPADELNPQEAKRNGRDWDTETRLNQQFGNGYESTSSNKKHKNSAQKIHADHTHTHKPSNFLLSPKNMTTLLSPPTTPLLIKKKALPETNSSPLKIGRAPKGNPFSNLRFSGANLLLVSGRKKIHGLIWERKFPKSINFEAWAPRGQIPTFLGSIFYIFWREKTRADLKPGKKGERI